MKTFLIGAGAILFAAAIWGALQVGGSDDNHKANAQQASPTATTSDPGKGPGATNTPVPTATIAPSGNPGVPTPTANCPTTGDAQKAIGVKVVRTGTEACTWEYHSAPNLMHIHVPQGYVATLTLADGKGGYKNIVTTQGEYDITDGTWRFMAAFPQGDPARDNPCGLLAKEQFFGKIENPSFPVEAGPGLNCGGTNPGLPSGNGNLDPKLQAVIRAYCVGDCSGMVLDPLVEANGSVNPLGAKVVFNGQCYQLNIPAGVTWDDDKGSHQGPQNNVSVCEASLRMKN